MSTEDYSVRFALLEEEISSLKGIIHVMLEEMENGSISDTARRIREVLMEGKQNSR